MTLSSAFSGSRLALCGVVLSAAVGCGGEFTAANGSGGGIMSGGKHGGGAGGATGSGGDSDSGVSGSGGIDPGSGGDGSGGAIAGGAGGGGAGGRAAGGRGSGGRATGGASTGGASTGGTSSGGTAGTTGAGGATGGTGTGGSSTTQLASSYDQKCSYDGNCSLVAQGDVCTCNARCPNAAIASTAINQWNADRAKLVCADPPVCPAIACAQMLASCAGGSCIARRPLVIDASHYDQQCATLQDCVQIYTGEVCSSCQCSIGAVSQKGYQDYLRDKSSVMCTPGPSACDCVPVGTVTCSIQVGQDKGTCTVL